MKGKTYARSKAALYIALLLLALLLETSVFGVLTGGITPAAVAVMTICIAMQEGAGNGAVYGLVGGMLWAWSRQGSMYGAYTIVMLALLGLTAGLLTEHFLLGGIFTAVLLSIPAAFLTQGITYLYHIFTGALPTRAILSGFLPELGISLLFSIPFFFLTRAVSNIGGTHG